MEHKQIIVFSIIILALILFAWGKFRHDITAVICLLLLFVTGTIKATDAFLGFSHPAVITVAVILIISEGLKNSGLIDLIGKWIDKLGNHITLQIAVLSTVVAIASAFMNNVGALAVLMPVAIHIAVKNDRSPSLFLMPLAFASLLGGMGTLIGTPPNIIISTFRNDNLGERYSMFDFMPVGAVLILFGLFFIILVAWRIIPKRATSNNHKARFNIEEYITEVLVTEECKLSNVSLAKLSEEIDINIQVLNVVRNNQLLHAPDMSLFLKPGDILTIQADSDDLKNFIQNTRAELVGSNDSTKKEEVIGSENISNVEAVVMAESRLFNRSARSLNMRHRFGINLLAISRQGQQIRKRIDHVNFKVGDVLLLQGDEGKIDDTLRNMGCLPLADRGFNIGKPNKIITALVIFIASIILVISGVLPVEIAFTLAALLMVLGKVISQREIYNNIDWPVIVLLGAMLPLGGALESTGGADLIAEIVLILGSSLPPWVTLSLLFLVTMLLSNVINNAATVVLMAPIGLSIAQGLQVSADPFLMAIAVSSSAAFLTPIGHQSNTLVMGPGGYKFTDFTIVGIPMSLLIMMLAIPMIIWVWPF